LQLPSAGPSGANSPLPKTATFTAHLAPEESVDDADANPVDKPSLNAVVLSVAQMMVMVLVPLLSAVPQIVLITR
jgi:hypothetical protein